MKKDSFLKNNNMRIYRVKEKNERFYPQYKNGWKTAWCWEYFYETPIIVYPKGNFRTHDPNVRWACVTLQQRNY